MSTNDREINVRVEQQLTRRGIDTSKLTVSAHQGDVMIQGALQKRSIRESAMSSSDMKMLDRSLRRVRDVRNIIWNLQNWEKHGTSWRAAIGHKQKGGDEGGAPVGAGAGAPGAHGTDG